MVGNSETRVGLSALILILMTLHLVMLLALFAGVPPHPPARVAPFAMAPFLAVVLGVGAAAILLNRQATQVGLYLSGIVAILSLVSFGPQKYLDPAIPLIWPAVVTAQVSIIAIGANLVTAMREYRHAIG